MEIKVDRTGTVIVVSLKGAVDLVSAPPLRAKLNQLLTHAAPKLVIDLSGVDHLDSYGLGILVEAVKRARQTGGDTRLCAPRPDVREILDVTGLSKRISVLPSRRDALVSWFSAKSSSSPD